MIGWNSRVLITADQDGRPFFLLLVGSAKLMSQVWLLVLLKSLTPQNARAFIHLKSHTRHFVVIFSRARMDGPFVVRLKGH